MSLAQTPLATTSSASSGTRARAVRTAAFASTRAFLSGIDRMDRLWAAAITLDDDRGFLLPVCAVHAMDMRIEAAPLDAGESGQRFIVVTTTGAAVSELAVIARDEPFDTMRIEIIRVPTIGAATELTQVALRVLVRWCDDHFQPHDIVAGTGHTAATGDAIFAAAGFDVTPDPTAPRPFRRRHALPEQWPSLILTAGPLISARESVYASDAARNGWNGQWSKYLTMLEQEFAAYVGTKYAIATSSCTGALHLALLALDIEPGDEVIVPDCTWVATANAVLYAGATPVFADVDRDTWTLDPASFESLITPRTKAVIPVHMYGHPADMRAIGTIAERHGLKVVEDAAPSIGAECGGQRTGSFGDFACFSFQGAKLMVTGEGGMICTNDDTLYRKVFKIWDQGRQPGGFWIDANGWKYKMSNVQAALGAGQLQHVDSMIEAKRRIADWYRDGLAGVDGITVWQEAPWARSIYWMSSIMVHDDAVLDRDALRVALKARNVDTRSVFPAISQYPIWPRQQAAQPNALHIGDHGINLPSGVRLTEDEVAYTCQSIRRALQQ